MKYWLIVFLFDVNGDFQMKDIAEATSLEHCENSAAAYAKTIVNTKMMAQFHCVSDNHYQGREQDLNIAYD